MRGGAISFAFTGFGETELIVVENSRARKVAHPRNDGFLYVDGGEVMNFSLNEVPALIEKFLADNQLNANDISMYAIHQANRRIVTSVADKLNVPKDKVPFVMSDTGNVSSASIPCMLTRCANDHKLDKVLCCGFGAGLSIGVCLVDFSKTKFYGVVELE